MDVSGERLNNSNTSLGTTDGENVNVALDLQAQEVYERFVRSVFCDENIEDANFTKSFASCTDEDDEEEYQPQCRDDTNDDEGDDDEDDEDEEEEEIEKIGKDEVKDLMEGVYQTLAGEIPIPNHLGPFSPIPGNEKSDYTCGTGSQSGASGLTAQCDKSNPSNASFSLASGASMESPVKSLERCSPRKTPLPRSPLKRGLDQGGIVTAGSPGPCLAFDPGHLSGTDGTSAPPKKIQRSKDVTFADHPLTHAATSRSGEPGGVAFASGSLEIFGGRASLPTAPLPGMDIDDDAEDSRTKYIAPQRGSLLARLVSQLFSKDTREHDLLIEGMPVGTIRKLVARQVSMGLQLLMQLMMLSPEGSDTFTRCYESFLELSNCRQTSLKKIALMRMNLETFKDFESLQRREQMGEDEGGDFKQPRQSTRLNTRTTAYKPSQPRAPTLSGGESKVPDPPEAEAVNAVACTSSTHNTHIGMIDDNALSAENAGGIAMLPCTARMTRSRAVRSTEGHASGSVLDLGPLAQLDSLFERIDHARRAMPADGAGSTRAMLLRALQDQIDLLFSKIRCRRFECLTPLQDFPLPEEDMRRLGPSSLVGRLFFTPAEDDLLLRGCVAHGDGHWATVKDGYLRSKAEPALLHRFNQMIESSEENKFRQYQRLCEGYRTRDLSWALSEDLSLLHGFMVHGESWPLIQIFFLPQRPVKDLVQRWYHLQMLCVDGNDGQVQMNSHDTSSEFPATVSEFILHLQAGGAAGIGASRGIEVERRGAVIVVEGAGGGQTHMSGGSGSSTESSAINDVDGNKHTCKIVAHNVAVKADSIDKKKKRRGEHIQISSSMSLNDTLVHASPPLPLSQSPRTVLHALQTQVPTGSLLDLQQLQHLQQLQMQSVQMQLNGMSTMSRLIMNLLPGSALDPAQRLSLQQVPSPDEFSAMHMPTGNLLLPPHIPLKLPPVQEKVKLSSAATAGDEDVDSDQMDDSEDEDTPPVVPEKPTTKQVIAFRNPTPQPQTDLLIPMPVSGISSNGLFASVMARVDKEQFGGGRK